MGQEAGVVIVTKWTATSSTPYGGQTSWTSGFGKHPSQIHLDILVHTIICHTWEFLTLNVGLKAQLKKGKTNLTFQKMNEMFGPKKLFSS